MPILEHSERLSLTPKKRPAVPNGMAGLAFAIPLPRSTQIVITGTGAFRHDDSYVLYILLSYKMTPYVMGSQSADLTLDKRLQFPQIPQMTELQSPGAASQV